jgi:hypothetical protein
MTIIEWLDRYAGWLLSALIIGVFLGLVSGVWILVVATGVALAVIIALVLIGNLKASSPVPGRIPVREHRPPIRDDEGRDR